MGRYRGVALTVAGSDSGGGAGIQADLKTFAALRVFGTSALAAVTVQNSLGVRGFHPVPEETVRGQIDAVCSDFPVGAVKTGMLASQALVRATAEALEAAGVRNLVVDPVMVSQSGDPLLGEDAAAALRDRLLPLALLATPNLPEAEVLLGRRIPGPEAMEEAARDLLALGPKGVLLKGGHLEGEELVDVLALPGDLRVFRQSRLHTENTHGTGCTLSAAVAAELAAGCDLPEAVDRGRRYLRQALEAGVRYGRGHGCPGHGVTPPWVDRR